MIKLVPRDVSIHLFDLYMYRNSGGIHRTKPAKATGIKQSRYRPGVAQRVPGS